MTIEEQIKFIHNFYCLCGTEDGGKAKNGYLEVLKSLEKLLKKKK